MTVSDFLLIHVLVIGILLAIVMHTLIVKKLFNWLTSGFWAWAAFTLYFFIPPLYALCLNEMNMFELDLSISGGIERGLWILLVLTFGIGIFFVAYLRSIAKPLSWNLATTSTSPRPSLVPLVMMFFLAIGIYSLFSVRGAFISSDRAFIIEQGRFIGDASGWEYNAHAFVIVPILFLMVSGKKAGLIVGGLLATAYIVISALDPWGRYTIVSMIIAVSLVFLTQRRKNRPNPLWIVTIIFAALVLQARGHTRFEGVDDFVETINSVTEKSNDLFLGGETAMLRSFYIQSYVRDNIGYDYAIPTINYVFLGFLPSRYFPNKYMLIEWLESQQGSLNDPIIQRRLYGAKSSLIGSFYGHAGLFGVFFFMAIAGILSRKLDTMIRLEAPILVRSTGLAIMSVLWMIWGSSDTWAIMIIGIILIPTILLWIVSAKQPSLFNKTYGSINKEHG